MTTLIVLPVSAASAAPPTAILSFVAAQPVLLENQSADLTVQLNNTYQQGDGSFYTDIYRLVQGGADVLIYHQISNEHLIATSWSPGSALDYGTSVTLEARLFVSGLQVDSEPLVLSQASFGYSDHNIELVQGVPTVYRPSNFFDCAWDVPVESKTACPSVSVGYNQSIESGMLTRVYREDGSALGTPTGPSYCVSAGTCQLNILGSFADPVNTLTVMTIRKLPGYTGSFYVDSLNEDPGHLQIAAKLTFVLSRKPYLMNTVPQGNPGEVTYRLNQPIAAGMGVYVYDNLGHRIAGPLTGEDALSFSSPWFSVPGPTSTTGYAGTTCASLRSTSTDEVYADACPGLGVYNSEAVHSQDEDFLSGGDDPSVGPVACYSGDPVSCRSGYLWESKADLVIPGRFPIKLMRSYNSNHSDKDYGLFGYGWSSPFDAALTESTVVTDDGTFGYVKIKQENGAVIKFYKSKLGGWTPQYSLVDATLTKNGDNSWTLVRKSLTTLKFTPSGVLDWVEDNNGVRISVTRTPSQITAATPDGRTLTMILNGAGRISSATGPDGRLVTYGFTSGNLASVAYNYRTTPTDVADKTLGYGYDGVHRLTSVTSPGGASVSTYYEGSSARVDYQVDALGKAWDFSYNTTSAGVWQVTTQDPTGVQVRYEYEGSVPGYAGSLVRKVMNPTGSGPSIWSYQYDKGDHVENVTDPMGRVSLASYENGRMVTQALPVAGKETSLSPSYPGYLTYGYNSKGQVNSVSSYVAEADGSLTWVTTTISYDSFGNTTQVSRPLNATQTAVTRYVYEASRPGVLDSIVDPRGKTWDYTVDSRGFVTALDAPGTEGIVSLTNDNYGKVTSRTLPMGTATPSIPSDYKTNYTYYPNSSLLKSVTKPSGLVVEYRYDSNGQQVKRIDPGGNVWQTTWTADRRVFKQISPLGNTTEYRYDAAGRLTREIDPTGVSSQTNYSPTTGWIESVIAPAGTAGGASPAVVAAATTTYVHNLAGDVLSTSMPDPNGGQIVHGYTYDPYSGDLTKYTSPRGLETKYIYDRVGRPWKVTLPSETGSARTYRTEYDWASRVVREVDPGDQDVLYTYDEEGNVLQTQDRRDKKSTYTYDDVGRLKTWVDPRGYDSGNLASDYKWTNLYNPNGWQTGTTNPLGVSNQTTYDEDGRRTSVVDRNGVTSKTWSFYTSGSKAGKPCLVKASDGGMTGYDYDADARRTKMVTPDVDGIRNPAATTTCSNLDFTDATTLGYDSASRLTNFDPPVLAATTTTYKPDTGLKDVATLPGGSTITYTYDSLNRTQKVDYSASNTPDLNYAYNKDSQPLTLSNGTSSQSYTFGYSTLTGELTSSSVGTDTYTYAYDQLGNVTQRTRPGSAGTDLFVYDNESNLKQVDPYMSGVSTTDFTYDSAGNRVSYKNNTNFWREDYTFDRVGRLQKVEDFAGTTIANQASIGSKTMYRDNVGNPTSVKNVRGTSTEWANYAYDSQNRVKGACYGTTQTTCAQAASTEWFTYDLAGNRKSMSVNNSTPTNYTYNDNNALTAVGSASLTYDAVGNMTSNETARTFTYDSASRMLTSKTSGASAADKYIYDAMGNRQTVQLAGSLTNINTYRYDVNNPLPIVDKVVTTAATSHYVHDGQTAIGQKQSSTTQWFGFDLVSSITDVYYDDPATTTLKGVRARAFDYKPFGDSRIAVGAPTTTAGLIPDMRFTGAVRDDSQQYQMRAREYSVTTGRFNEQDPLRRTLGAFTSQYGYVKNRPTVLTDPSGMVEASSVASDFLEWVTGARDASEFDNLTSLGTDTAMCAVATTYDTLVVPLVSAIPVNPFGMLASQFNATDVFTRNLGMDPCSAACATGNNLVAAGTVLSLAIPFVGEARLATMVDTVIARVSLGATRISLGATRVTLGATRAANTAARSSSVVDDLLAETAGATQRNLTSSYTVTADEALTAGRRWVGEGYVELGKPGSGVFRSADGLRQFRMDGNSLMGNHAPGVPHVHLETYAPGARVPSVNNHIPFSD